jgi:hypothetical protein
LFRFVTIERELEKKHFVENHFVKIHKIDQKQLVDYFVENTYEIKKTRPNMAVLGVERTGKQII